MKSRDDKIKLIEQAFQYAHCKRRGHPVTPEWERKVMAHVLDLRAKPLQTVNPVWESPAVWRTAAAVSISALIVLAWSLLSDVSAEYEVARFLIEDPVTFILTQSFLP